MNGDGVRITATTTSLRQYSLPNLTKQQVTEGRTAGIKVDIICYWYYSCLKWSNEIVIVIIIVIIVVVVFVVVVVIISVIIFVVVLLLVFALVVALRWCEGVGPCSLSIFLPVPPGSLHPSWSQKPFPSHH